MRMLESAIDWAGNSEEKISRQKIAARNLKQLEQ